MKQRLSPHPALIEPTSAVLDGRPDSSDNSCDRSHAMYLLTADLARAHMQERMREARQQRLAARSRRLRRAERLLRRAERAHLRARRALAHAVLQ
jgi:hypothetical protein